MRNQKKIYIYIFISVIVMGFMIFSLVQMLGYANIINDAGIVRGGTQRLVKLELAHMPNNELSSYIDDLIEKLEKREASRSYISSDTQTYGQDLAAVNEAWDLVKKDIQAYRTNSSTENAANLLSHSEEHFKKANTAVFSAQYRAENELKLSLITSIAVFLIFTALVIIIEYRGQREVKRVFYTDHLTDLPNQPAFDQAADGILSSSAPGTYCAIYINVNNFKFVNSSYGFNVGDNLLKSIAKTIRNFCKGDELCGRLHADHFVMLIKWRSNLSETLHTLFNETIKNEKDLNFSDILSCSCGIYRSEKMDESAASCISKANLALKEGLQDPNRCAFYDQYLTDKITTENKLSLVMKKALANKEFEVYLQAKVDFTDLRIIGAESLVRWNSSDYGFLPPDSFIPLFEKNGFIVNIDFFVLEETCKILKETLDYEAQSVIPISVNISRVTLFQDGFTSRLMNIVDQYNIPHQYLEIEITETVFVFDTQPVLQILNQVRFLGFKISMDDFGSGYSSLKMLKDLPIDVIKIDRAFLQEGLSQERSYSIIKCVVEMAHSLNMKVVCEGVETIEHVHFLKDVDCAIGQGFYFSKPIPIADFSNNFQLLLRNP